MTSELLPQSWQEHDATYAAATFRSMLRRLPGLVATAFGIAWRASRADTLASAATSVGAGAMAAVSLVGAAEVLRNLFAPGPTPERLRAALPSLLLVATAAGLRASLMMGAQWAQRRLAPLVGLEVEARLLHLSTSTELAAFDDHGWYDALVRARDRGTMAAPGVVAAGVDVTMAAIALAAVGGALAVLHPVLLALLVVAAVPRGWGAVRAARVEYLSMYARSAIRRRRFMLSSLMADAYSAVEVRAFTARRFLLRHYHSLARREARADLRVAGQQIAASALGSALSGVGMAAVYAALWLLLAGGVMDLAVAGAAVVAIQLGQSALTSLVQAVNRIYEEGLYLSDYQDFCRSCERRLPKRDGPGLPPSFENLTVEGVTFTYPAAGRPALRDVSLEVNRGEVVALVGENGSGKTTLAKLVAGLYQPDSGQVRWDGHDLAEVPAEDVWRHVALVPQAWVRWPLSARHNIVIGDTDRTDEAVALPTAARAAGADEVIASLPDGYDTMLHRSFRNGFELSWGQWQRIVIARGFYRDAPLLICDEPTAALDAKAEHALYERLRHLAAERTVILITHRLASVRNADRIYVLDHGQVIESGTHDTLLAAGGRYAELFTLQAAAYSPTPAS